MTMKSTEDFINRSEILRARFREYFGSEPERLFSAPGATELLGGDTEEHGGKAIVSALSCDLLAAVSPRSDGFIEVVSDSFPPIRFSVYDLGSREREKGKPVALVRGVLSYLAGAGYRFGGFSAYTRGQTYCGEIGSASSFEVIFAEIVSALYQNDSIPPMVKAYAAQYAENVYFGNPAGLLDKIGVAFGGVGLVEFGQVKFRPLPVPDLRIVLTAVGESPRENTREMGEVASCFGKKFLGEVGEGEFYERLGDLRRTVSDRALLRAMYFFEENARSDRAFDALSGGDLRALFNVVGESGESVLGVIGCALPNAIDQPVAIAIKAGRRYLGEGACRMVSGERGMVLAISREGAESVYCRELSRIFGKGSVLSSKICSAGAREIRFSEEES